MIHETYDPIVQQRSGLPLLLVPLRPQRGTALVLERRDGRLDVVVAGVPVPGRRSGGHRASYLVDTSVHGLTFAVPARSADPWSFSVTFRLSCRVVDPTVVVRSSCRDMAAAVYESMAGVARNITPKFGVLAADRATIEIQDVLRDARSPDGLDLSVVSVDVEAADAQDLMTTRRNLLLEQINREARRDVAKGSRDEMLAHFMAINGGDPSAYLRLEREAQERDDKNHLDLVKVLLESGGLPAGESSRISKRMLEHMLPSSQHLRSGQYRGRLPKAPPGVPGGARPVIDATGQAEAEGD
ncbi:hypothetical protein FHX81_7757 [Saccharothrix saharensis]|uniref:Uncharacterized protein n=1 Tax=Saccharothrix saharensis TaxID=571190 RepID=A0A543JR29_9PSEU|nr:hypothetical protein [Saccharothrix saharensis]TQM85278.1 hypothetical protein FHX81_7757 [Saccharothrix saharensis]